MIGIANDFLSDVWGWVIGAVVVAIYALVQLAGAVQRRAGGLMAKPSSVLLLQIAGLAVVTFARGLVREQGPRRAQGRRSSSASCSCSGRSSRPGRASAATSTPSAATPKRPAGRASTSTVSG